MKDRSRRRARVGDKVALQGNLDPAMLYARPDVIRDNVGDVLRRFGHHPGHVFNLGHGVTPQVNPDHVAALVSVELCSLTYTAAEPTMASLVGSALFGDGAAAVIAAGERRAEEIGVGGPEVLDSRSRMYPDSLDTMGWKVGPAGLQLILSPNLPELIDRYLADDMSGFLADHDLIVGDIAAWVSHPGGPKVIEAITASLGLLA